MDRNKSLQMTTLLFLLVITCHSSKFEQSIWDNGIYLLQLIQSPSNKVRNIMISIIANLCAIQEGKIWLTVDQNIIQVFYDELCIAKSNHNETMQLTMKVMQNLYRKSSVLPVNYSLQSTMLLLNKYLAQPFSNKDTLKLLIHISSLIIDKFSLDCWCNFQEMINIINFAIANVKKNECRNYSWQLIIDLYRNNYKEPILNNLNSLITSIFKYINCSSQFVQQKQSKVLAYISNLGRKSTKLIVFQNFLLNLEALLGWGQSNVKYYLLETFANVCNYSTKSSIKYLQKNSVLSLLYNISQNCQNHDQSLYQVLMAVNYYIVNYIQTFGSIQELIQQFEQSKIMIIVEYLIKESLNSDILRIALTLRKQFLSRFAQSCLIQQKMAKRTYKFECMEEVRDHKWAGIHTLQNEIQIQDLVQGKFYQTQKEQTMSEFQDQYRGYFFDCETGKYYRLKNCETETPQVIQKKSAKNQQRPSTAKVQRRNRQQQKPVFFNYGYGNTNPSNGGVIYGNYLQSFNVLSDRNNPKTNQLADTAAFIAKRNQTMKQEQEKKETQKTTKMIRKAKKPTEVKEQIKQISKADNQCQTEVLEKQDKEVQIQKEKQDEPYEHVRTMIPQTTYQKMNMFHDLTQGTQRYGAAGVRIEQNDKASSLLCYDPKYY